MSDETAKVTHNVHLRPEQQDCPTFVVRAWMINEICVGVEAFEPIGIDAETEAPLYLIDGWTASPADSTLDIEKAEKYVEGSIKWDGCSNLMVCPRDPQHFCSKAQAVRVGELLGRMYDIAAEMLKPADIEMFEGRGE